MPYFIYCRKSLEEESRQIQSIADQLKSAKTLAATAGLLVVDTIEEAMSAKRPGRPKFEAMLKRIEKGEADGIIAWHPDRLSRNAIDAGRIIDLVDRGKIKNLKFESYRFENTAEGKWMLSIVLGQSKYFVDKLSTDVKRGMRGKLERGEFPHRAPAGYLNDPGSRQVIKDPERFDLIRRAIDYMLTGAYSAPHVLDLLNNSWGFRSRRIAKTGGKPMLRSCFYDLLRNKFYCGILEAEGELFQGNHPPIMSIKEFEQIQRTLGRLRNPDVDPNKALIKNQKKFPYAGVIRCGRCGCQITAECKTKIYKTTGNRAEYVYYHCSNAKRVCNKVSIKEEKITDKVLSLLVRLWSDDEMKNWNVSLSTRGVKEDAAKDEDAITALELLLKSAEKRKSRLIEERYTSEGMLSDAEFLEIKTKIQAEINDLQVTIQKTKEREAEAEQTLKNVINFSAVALETFQSKDTSTEVRKQVVKRLGINYFLTLGNLEIEVNPLLEPLLTFGPVITGSRIVKTGSYTMVNPLWWTKVNEIRKIITERPDLTFPPLDLGNAS